MDFPPSTEFAQENPQIISVVQTPLSEYIVLNHTNNNYVPSKVWPDWDEKLGRKGGIYSLAFTNFDKDIKEYVYENLDSWKHIKIEQEKSKGNSYKLPTGTIEEILSDDFILPLAKKKRKKLKKAMKEMNSNQDLPTLDFFKEDYQYSFARSIWFQLIRRSAPSPLHIEHDEPIGNFFSQDEGFIVAAKGLNDNCGRGIAKNFMYKILAKDTVEQPGEFFSFRNYKITAPIEGFMSFLPTTVPNYNLKPEALDHGMVIDYHGEPLYVSFDRDSLTE